MAEAAAKALEETRARAADALRQVQLAALFAVPTCGIDAGAFGSLRQELQALVPGSPSDPARADAFYPAVIISFAPGRRTLRGGDDNEVEDVEGAGPGLVVACALARLLFVVGAPCFLGPMAPSAPHAFVLSKLPQAETRVCVALLSRAFYEAEECLEELHVAVSRKKPLLLIRVESDLPNLEREDAADIWPQSVGEEEAKRKRSVVIAALRAAPQVPSGGAAALLDAGAEELGVQSGRPALLRRRPAERSGH